MTSRRDSSCPSCGYEALPWLTTCARCDRPLTGGAAPTSTPTYRATRHPEWVDIPVAADQPAEVALLCHFFAEHGVELEATRRFVSVRAEAALALLPEIEIWAFDHDFPEDDRHSDSLAATQVRVGTVVLQAIATTTGVRVPIPSPAEVSGGPRERGERSSVAAGSVDLRSID